jgi:hypothetical protein
MSLLKLFPLAVAVTLAAGSVACVAQTSDAEPEALGTASEAAFPASGQATYFSNVELPAGTKYTTPDGRTFLTMQSDGNLVLYFAPFGASVWAREIWASNTAGHPGAHAAMQADGNLVVWASSTDCIQVPFGPKICGYTLWQAQTSGSGVQAAVQNDGNFVVYAANGNALWASGTNDNVPPSSMCINEPKYAAYFCPAGSWWRSCDTPSYNPYAGFSNGDGNIVVWCTDACGTGCLVAGSTDNELNPAGTQGIQICSNSNGTLSCSPSDPDAPGPTD